MKHTLQQPSLTPPANWLYKDRLFHLLFSDKAALLSLYNALNGTHYDNPDDLVITTLENTIYMGMHNDVSCIFSSRAGVSGPGTEYQSQSQCGTAGKLYHAETVYGVCHEGSGMYRHTYRQNNQQSTAIYGPAANCHIRGSRLLHRTGYP